MNNDGELMDKIKELTESYDSDHKKPVFFKNSQKMERAEMVTQNIQLNELLEHTVYTMPNTNKIFIEYLYFKTYAYPDIYDKVAERLICVLDEIKLSYGNYEIFVNLDSITISALERHKNLIKVFYDICIKNDLVYSNFLTKCIFYNVPNMIDTIKLVLFPFLMSNARNIVEFYNRSQTEYIMNPTNHS